MDDSSYNNNNNDEEKNNHDDNGDDYNYCKKPKWHQLFEIVNGLLTLLPNSDGFHYFRLRIEMISLYKRLFQKLSIKSNNPSLVNDKSLHDAMYFDSYKSMKNNVKLNYHDNKKNEIKFSDKDKLFQQYILSQPQIHSSL